MIAYAPTATTIAAAAMAMSLVSCMENIGTPFGLVAGDSVCTLALRVRCDAPKKNLKVGGLTQSIAGAAPYSSSLTWSPHVAALPSLSTSSIARWVMNRLGAAPCQ
jgi:hypothetical protein